MLISHDFPPSPSRYLSQRPRSSGYAFSKWHWSLKDLVGE